MRKTSFFAPYTGTRTNLIWCKDKAGVYIIREGAKIVYIGFSGSDIYKTCIRHFQKWRDRTQVRVVYSDRSDITVRIVITTPARAAALERALIVKHRPRDNSNKLENYLPNEEDIQAEKAFKDSRSIPPSYWEDDGEFNPPKNAKVGKEELIEEEFTLY